MNNEHTTDPKQTGTEVTPEPSETNAETLKPPRKFIIVAIPHRQKSKDPARLDERRPIPLVRKKNDKFFKSRRILCGVEVWRGGLGGAYLLPTLSSVGASLAPPCVRFHTPLIEPDVRIFRIRLSEEGSRCRPREIT